MQLPILSVSAQSLNTKAIESNCISISLAFLSGRFMTGCIIQLSDIELWLMSGELKSNEGKGVVHGLYHTAAHLCDRDYY